MSGELVHLRTGDTPLREGGGTDEGKHRKTRERHCDQFRHRMILLFGRHHSPYPAGEHERWSGSIDADELAEDARLPKLSGL